MSKHDSEQTRKALAQVEALYAVGITDHVRGLMDADGPVTRQYAPDPRELIVDARERDDPIGDTVHSPVAGIVHRYPDRALLMALSVCAVYCRFCFRRETVGQGAGLLSEEDLGRAFSYIEDHPELREIILSGGDPLILSTRRLGAILTRLDRVPHLDMLRIHSRVPVAEPSRINEALCDTIAKLNKPLYIVIHVNHAQEITGEVRASLRALRRAGAILLSQSVLLKGVNDDEKVLEDLFRSLLREGVKPYYLHHPDRAKGTGHFRVSLARGREIVKNLRGRISGLAQPAYMLDIPGGFGKAPVGESMVEYASDEGAWLVEDWQGARHIYQDGDDQL